jgi:hypothetical protein
MNNNNNTDHHHRFEQIAPQVLITGDVLKDNQDFDQPLFRNTPFIVYLFEPKNRTALIRHFTPYQQLFTFNVTIDTITEMNTINQFTNKLRQDLVSQLTSKQEKILFVSDNWTVARTIALIYMIKFSNDKIHWNQQQFDLIPDDKIRNFVKEYLNRESNA